MAAFGFVAADKQRDRVDVLNERALAVLAGIVAKDEFDQMEREVRSGLREIRVENGCVVTCLTPRP